MVGVAGEHGTQGVRAGGEINHRLGVAVGVERGAGKRTDAVLNNDRTGDGLAVFTGYADGKSGAGAAVEVVRLRGKAGLRGLLRRREGGKGGSHGNCGKPGKPQKAAGRTSHVHLLQKQKNSRTPGLWQLAPYCIRRGRG